MTKRFKVHSMIQDMEIGETMDLECCKELIEKYGSSIDIDLLITDNGKDMTYRQVCDLLNESEQLKQQIKIFEKFLEENDLNIINWEEFCEVDECAFENPDTCKECIHLKGDIK